jgi:lysophospholipase L1-like esterase
MQTIIDNVSFRRFLFHKRDTDYSKFHTPILIVSGYIHNIALVLIFPALFLLCFQLPILASSDSTKHWVGTWSTAPYEAGTNTPPIALTNNTLRQIVRVSIGGDTLRLKFSNITFAKPITINSVNIAVSPDGTKSPVTASTTKELKFKGNSEVTIDSKSEVYSDPVAFDLKPNMRLAITTYYGQCETSSTMTHHYGSRTDSYILTGNKATDANFSGATIAERWYTISAIEVLSPKSTASVAIIGNSITDGYGLHGGLQDRWTDAFSEKLLKNTNTSQIGVLNLGIGATMVTGAANGAKSGVDRFDHDVLQQAGVKWVIIFYGINDINANVTATAIINGIKSMITAAHAKNLKVYGATITPVNGNAYYSPAHEKTRGDVNKWIRTDSSLDGFFDFDKVIRNPSDTTRLQQQYSNDWLHPSAAGYKVLGESIDTKYFETPVAITSNGNFKTAAPLSMDIRQSNGAAAINFNLPQKSFVSLKMYTIAGREIAEIAGKYFERGSHFLRFEPGSGAKGMYVVTFKCGNYSESSTIIFQH